MRPKSGGNGSKSAEQDLAKEFRGRIGDGVTFIRRPDGSLEIMGKIPGKKAGATEFRVLESTLQNDFEAEIGYAGGRQAS